MNLDTLSRRCATSFNRLALVRAQGKARTPMGDDTGIEWTDAT